MASRGRDIHDLPEKFRVIAEELYRVSAVDSRSPTALEPFFGVSYDTLKKAWNSGRLSKELERLVAEKTGFSVGDPTWVDDAVPPLERSKRVPDLQYDGRDTVENFRKMLSAVVVGPNLDVPRLLIEDEPAKLLDETLVTFKVEGTGQGALPSQGSQLFFSINVSAGQCRNFVFGFRCARLRLAFDRPLSSAQAERRLGTDSPIVINDALLVARGNADYPEWLIHVAKGILLGDYNTTESPFCTIEDLRLGEEFHAEVSVQLIDGSLSTVDGTALPSVQKQRLIELLTAKEMFGERNSTWLPLGRQRLRVVPSVTNEQ